MSDEVVCLSAKKEKAKEKKTYGHDFCLPGLLARLENADRIH